MAEHESDTPHPSDEDPTAGSTRTSASLTRRPIQDPYRTETPEDDADRASGVRGERKGAEE